MKHALNLAVSCVGLLGAVAAHAQRPDDDRTPLFLSAAKLSAREAATLERAVETHPVDLASRTRLLGYYFLHKDTPKTVAAYRKHVLWMIRHRPEAPAMETPYAQIDPHGDPEGFTAGKAAWLKQVADHPKRAAILGNAADYLLLHDDSVAEKLLTRAEALDPTNGQWPQQLGHLYSMRFEGLTGADRKRWAAQSLAACERALALSAESISRLSDLQPAAMSAFEAGDMKKAESYARELVEKADLGFPVGVDGTAIHTGDIVLGLVALTAGDIQTAEKRLLDAGRAPGAPTLESFGPNMRLAKELIEKGATKAVLEYFALCKRFWNRPELDAWTQTVKAGKVPDFGPNLVY